MQLLLRPLANVENMNMCYTQMFKNDSYHKLNYEVYFETQCNVYKMRMTRNIFNRPNVTIYLFKTRENCCSIPFKM